MKKTISLYIYFLALACIFWVNIPQTLAADNCSPLYNGGLTKQQYCFNPTPTSDTKSGTLPRTQITPLVANQLQQTKGGQPIYPPAKSKTTPSTGPEEWSLPALFLIGGLGFLLRKKTYHTR